MVKRTDDVWHPNWCARNHTCSATRPNGEHRAEPFVLRIPGAGSAVLTRIRSAGSGVEHAEIRMSVTLPGYEPHARSRLTALLSHLRILIGPPRAPQPAATGRELPQHTSRRVA